jgi:hypothetical protein
MQYFGLDQIMITLQSRKKQMFAIKDQNTVRPAFFFRVTVTTLHRS